MCLNQCIFPFVNYCALTFLGFADHNLENTHLLSVKHYLWAANVCRGAVTQGDFTWQSSKISGLQVNPVKKLGRQQRLEPNVWRRVWSSHSCSLNSSFTGTGVRLGEGNSGCSPPKGKLPGVLAAQRILIRLGWNPVHIFSQDLQYIKESVLTGRL